MFLYTGGPSKLSQVYDIWPVEIKLIKQFPLIIKANSSSMDSILSQFNKFLTSTSCFSKINSNIILQSMSVSSQVLFPRDFPLNICVHFYITYAISMAHPLMLHLINITILCKEYKLCSSFGKFLLSPVNSS